MIESIENVLSRMQEIRDRFCPYSSSGENDSFNGSFKEILEENIDNRENLPQNTKLESKFDNIIEKKASQYQVDPKLVKAVIKVESNFNPQAVSPKGAMGLMQLITSTAKDLKVEDVFNPEENIEGGVKYLKSLLEDFNQNLPLALAAYNAGPKRVKDARGIPNIKETQDYVKRVLELYQM
ncbi:lytic transglycosylase domain-containing protein [bacterium]|nr:lytic transglycosylase domain-containing protein [bacterium]MBU1782302.1 lytic transglycosylase domain-containing protein [bacterium]